MEMTPDSDLMARATDDDPAGSGPREVVQAHAVGPIDMIDVGRAPVARRLAPVVALVLLVVVIRWLRGRG